MAEVGPSSGTGSSGRNLGSALNRNCGCRSPSCAPGRSPPPQRDLAWRQRDPLGGIGLAITRDRGGRFAVDSAARTTASRKRQEENGRQTEEGREEDDGFGEEAWNGEDAGDQAGDVQARSQVSRLLS